MRASAPVPPFSTVKGSDEALCCRLTVLLSVARLPSLRTGRSAKRKASRMIDLLLLACSKRKRHTAGLLPAASRYDGGAFRVLRRAQREGHAPRNLAILIVSARYGLISSECLIEDYDQLMTAQRACDLCLQVSSRLDDELSQLSPQSVFASLGQRYYQTISSSMVFAQLEHAGIVQRARGRPGERMSQLRDWLWESAARHDGPVSYTRRGEDDRQEAR